MVCNTCGRSTVNDDANFCEYCGGSYREHVHTVINTAPQSQIAAERENKEKPISFLNWLGTYGLLLIPFVGWLIYLVMLFIWAFGNKTPESKKNWSRATLIYTAVSVILAIVILISYLMYFMNSPMYQDMLNGTFDYNSLYNSYQN